MLLSQFLGSGLLQALFNWSRRKASE